MTPCDDCAAARENNMLGRRFNNRGCIYCSARLIQALGRMDIPVPEITARRRVVVAEAVAAGFDEATVRALAKGKMAVEPLPEKKGK